MKATLEFTLPDERSDHQDAVDGTRWRMVVWDIDQYLRNRIKYEELPEPVVKVLQELRDTIRERLGDNNLKLEMIS